jgi:hypothetical protein
MLGITGFIKPNSPYKTRSSHCKVSLATYFSPFLHTKRHYTLSFTLLPVQCSNPQLATMARCSGACGSRQVQSSFTSRNQKHTSTSYTAPKPVKQRALPQQQEVVLEGYTVSYQAYNAFLTGPLNMLLVRAAQEHAAEKATVSDRPIGAAMRCCSCCAHAPRLSGRLICMM